MEAPTPMPRPDWYPPVDVSLGSDGGCTGFPSGLGAWDWSACCVAHDGGASDGWLLDCITTSAPGLPAALVVFAVFLMAAFRPLYNMLQRWGWVR